MESEHGQNGHLDTTLKPILIKAESKGSKQFNNLHIKKDTLSGIPLRHMYCRFWSLLPRSRKASYDDLTENFPDVVKSHIGTSGSFEKRTYDDVIC